jgi:two-component system response regulator YesN
VSRARAYSVLVVEDEPLIRVNIVRKLRDGCPEFEVVMEAADGREALEAIAELAPDVLITDIRMPELDGLQLAREAYYNHPEMMVVIVSGYDDFAYAKSALQFGVKDYLLKPVNAEELHAAMARLLVQLDREYRAGAAPRAQEELVTLVQEYLRAHFGEEVSLAALAERFHVNLPYLTRLFKRTIGVAPVRYLRDLRIAHARKLLQERPDLEIKEIGPMAGYPDPGYFSRIFRLSVGIGPQEYRERGNQNTEFDETNCEE